MSSALRWEGADLYALAVANKSPDGAWLRLNVLTAGDLAGELAFMDSRPRYLP
jgi:hypothetical protein